MRGTKGGKYPYKYLKMIDNVFGKDQNTIEVCSGSGNCFSVDINPETKPDLVDDGQKLESIPSSKFSRWRYDMAPIYLALWNYSKQVQEFVK
jgi:hypothetical protein